MAAHYQVIAFSSLDPDARDRQGEPHLSYPEALTLAREFKDQGKAFRVTVTGDYMPAEMDAFRDLGALL